MNDIILVGGGSHCKSVIDVIELEGRFRIAGIVEKPDFIGSSVLGYQIIGGDDDLKTLSKQYQFALITIGHIKSSSQRLKLFELAVNAGFTMASIVSPRAYVSQHSIIGNGVVVMHDVIINAGAKISDNCIINSKALIEHDAQISKHCHISTNATINGGVIIESGCFIGSGSITKEDIRILKNSFIKAGSIVS
tara:strand:+ start:805 stop:1383 length:579 start_codon:yes stop_codon:yes gene_type:complete